MRKTILLLLAVLFAGTVYAYDIASNGVFYNITSPTTVAVTSETEDYNSYSGAVVVPETVEYDGTLYTVTAVGDGAFGYCSNLTAVTLPATITSIGWSSFVYCTSLTAIVLPDAITTIGTFAFSGCSALQSVTLPASLTNLDYGAFQSCVELTSIALPESLVNIGDAAFYGCSLESVVIGDAVTNIGNTAFSECYLLAHVEIGSGVTNIGNYAFECASLEYLKIDAATPPTIYSRTFYTVPATMQLVVPCGSAETYSATEGWNAFSNISEDCTGVGERLADKVRIFPNPAINTLTISHDNFVSATLFTLSGACLLRSTEPEMNVAPLPSGCYLLRIETANGVVYQKVVKR